MLRLVNAFARRSVEPLAARPALVRLFSSPSASASTSGAGSTHEAGAPAPGKKEVKEGAYAHVSDADVLAMLRRGELLAYNLERDLGDAHRAVTVRRAFLARDVEAVSTLPHENYKFDYEAVKGACCENVIGFVSLPVGVAGPITVDGVEYHVPLATTEGALVASVHRGCKAISVSGGTHTIVLDDGMTRAPVLTMASAKRAGALREWLNAPDNYAAVEHAFNSTSRFARLKELKMFVAGRTVFLRFKCATGDAMGMNMITKGVTNALDFLQSKFDDLHIVSVSGNVCTDKKPSSINWTDGRGKSVVAEVVIPAGIVEKVLKTTVDALVEVNTRKNLVGSAVAGSIGGFNAHAANIVTAIYIACGQDPAQNVESSNCMTLMEKIGQDLHMSVSMPSIEVGTVGGGTNLPPQSACLNMLGVKGAAAVPGENARQLARVVASTVLAGELSLISALAAGHLLRSHMELNRKAHGAHKKH